MLEGFTISMSTFWILLFIIFLIAEAATAGLVSIWFCAGALCSFAAAKVVAAVYVQLIIFVIATAALFIFTRPFVKNVIKLKSEPTNLDRIIGQSVAVTEKIDNKADTGAIKYDGKVWTARSNDFDVTFEKGDFVTVDRIEGVKVIVK